MVRRYALSLSPYLSIDIYIYIYTYSMREGQTLAPDGALLVRENARACALSFVCVYIYRERDID
jgi:hypothetical protein